MNRSIDPGAAVRDVVAYQLGRHDVRSRDRLVEDLAAESADLVNLLAALEDRFRIAIGEEEAATLHSVADVEALVNRLLAGACPPER